MFISVSVAVYTDPCFSPSDTQTFLRSTFCCSLLMLASLCGAGRGGSRGRLALLAHGWFQTPHPAAPTLQPGQWVTPLKLFLTMCMKHLLFSAITLSLNCSLISRAPSHTIQSRWRWCRCSEYTTWGQRAALVFHVFLYVTFCTYPIVCCEMSELIMITTTIDTAVVHIHTYMQSLTCLM